MRLIAEGRCTVLCHTLFTQKNYNVSLQKNVTRGRKDFLLYNQSYLFEEIIQPKSLILRLFVRPFSCYTCSLCSLYRAKKSSLPFSVHSCSTQVNMQLYYNCHCPLNGGSFDCHERINALL